MAKTKGITSRTITTPTKVQPIWQISMKFPDGKGITKLKCTLNDLFDTYFLNIDKYLNKGYNAEQLYELYEKSYYNKGVKILIQYVDSWGHIWKGKIAWPRKDKFIDYLNRKINND